MAEFDCCICLEMLKPPILMCQCSQNFCKLCLQDCRDRSRSQFHCPTCRKVHKNDLSEFLRNRIVERLIEANNTPSITPTAPSSADIGVKKVRQKSLPFLGREKCYCRIIIQGFCRKYFQIGGKAKKLGRTV